MPRKSLAKHIFDELTTASWPGLEFDEEKQIVKIPNGNILELKKREYKLNFFWYSFDNKQYSQREKYAEIIFPKNFDIRSSVFFKRNGSYKLSREQQFKSIINPLDKEIKKIKLNNNYKGIKFYKNILLLPISIFQSVMQDAEYVYRKSTSYRTSTENYLSNVKSRDYSKNVKKRTTFLEKGEFNFLVDRLYLKSKNNKKDFLRYLDAEDIKSIEEFTTELLKNEVLSEDFLRRLNDYFIRERLKDVIQLGKQILSLKSADMNTDAAKQIKEKLAISEVNQLETLWQKYFEKNLLYLIFTYKKIFPKVELNNIEGDKKYPDFIGINHYNGLDVIEIKTHLKDIMVWDGSHENFYFSSEMSKAIVQTTNYMDAIMQERFKIPDDREKITKFTEEENLYHPRGIIVISSTSKLTNKKGEHEKLKRDFTKLRNSVQNIEILTFDEILNIADEYIKNIIPEVPNE